MLIWFPEVKFSILGNDENDSVVGGRKGGAFRRNSGNVVDCRGMGWEVRCVWDVLR